MDSLISWMDSRFYSNTTKNWDDLLFRYKIFSYIKNVSVVLDLGAGAGIVKEMNFRGSGSKICGVDLDQRVTLNPYLDEGKVCDAETIPYEANTFDLVFSDNVLEHLDNPSVVFDEIARVLKPGGVFLFKTPNKSHYMPLIARLTPHSFHAFINRLRGRSEIDTFPTRYKANSLKTVTTLAQDSGFEVLSIERIEGRPEYMRINFLTYIIGFLYERFVNLSRLFAPFRILLIGALKKKY